MVDNPIVWLLALPLAGAVIGYLVFRLAGRGTTSSQARARLDVVALACASAGILLAMLVALAAEGNGQFLGVAFDFTPHARTMLFVANIALLCSLFAGWSRSIRAERGMGLGLPAATSTLLGGALLARDGIVSVLCLLGAAIAIAMGACVISLDTLHDVPAGEAPVRAGKSVAGGLKHLSISVVGTCLLLVGVLLLSRYSLNLENRAVLQLGVGLMSVGLLVRAGAVPFAGAASDLVDAAPGTAISLFGAVTPAVLLTGLLLLAPIERALLAGTSTAWVGAVSVLLAGVRALGVHLAGRNAATGKGPATFVPGELLSATVAVPAGWALTGLLLASEAGAAGAFLLALNLALAVPLIIVSASRAGGGSTLFRVGLAVGVASLLGLPPLGGFAGTLLVAQAVATLGGFWLAVMLLGSMLVAAKWLTLSRFWNKDAAGDSQSKTSGPLPDTDLLLTAALVLAQIVLLASAGALTEMIKSVPAPWLR